MKQSIKLTDNRTRTFIASNRGFSLVEMIVATAVFIMILLITASAFNTILGKGKATLSSEESNTEGLVGLEILRHDLQQAGFGLFTDDSSTPSYLEAAGAPYSSYNDASAVPRAIVSDNNMAATGVLAGTDYLVIKGTTLARTSTSQLWTYVDDTGIPKIWGRDDFQDSSDKVIVIQQKLDRSKNMVVRTLKQLSSTNYGVAYSATGAFKDQDNNDVTDGTYTPSTNNIYYLYGIDHRGASFTLRAPFNRADFFVNRDASTPASCSPAAGVLYKAVMSHSDGTFDKIPILDCVADMQVVLGWNTSSEPENSNEVQAYSNADCSSVSGNLNGINLQTIRTDSTEVRKRLRLIMVYLLAQDGRLDRNFVNTNNSMLIGDQSLDPSGSLTRILDLTVGDFRNYRWKLYRVIVRPKNIF